MKIKILTKYINFEVAASRISSLIIGNIADIVSSPQQSLSWPMSALFLNFDDTNIVTEVWLVPGNYRGTILGNHPQISRTMFNFRRHLVRLQLLAFRATVARHTNSLSAVRRHNSFNSSGNVIVSSPGQSQSLVQNRLGATVTNLFLYFVCYVQCSSPYLNFGQVSLESCICVPFRVFTPWFSQDSPSAKNKLKN